MATTHTLAGVCIGLAVSAVAPAEAGPVVLAAALGGAAPDVDLLWDHRKTLHFPVWGTVVALLGVAVAVAVPTTATVAVATALVAAAVHAVSDLFGGGLSLRPWIPTSDRGVYEHARGVWHPPRRWVRYDGAPEDAFLALALALPAYAATSGVVRAGVVALLVVSVVYAATRRRIVSGGRRLLAALPPGVVRLIPDSLVEDLR
ncbi:MAG: metal-dependent hydrolase [Halobaculum sp.]